MASHDACGHPATPGARAKCRAAGGPAEKPVAAPTWTVTPRRTGGRRAAASVPLKRSNTRLRTIGDLTDVPPTLAVIIRAAWDRDGWEARVGEKYVHDERRILVTTPHGELSLVWRAVEGHHPERMAVFFRALDSSVTRRIDTVNGAMRLANGEDE